MELSHILAFNTALVAAMISPGPAFLMTVQTTLSAGNRAGVALGMGLGLMASIWTLSALLGLDAVFTLFPWAYVAVKTIGAVYLIYVAYSMWRGARDPIAKVDRPATRAFRQGMMVNALNPKSVLFAAAVLVVIFPADMTLGQNLLIAGNQLVMELAFYTALSFGMSRQAISRAYLAAKLYTDRCAAGVLGFLGLRLLVSRA